MPWMTRAAISMFMLIDSAAISEPTKKIEFTTSKHGLRPKISDTFPFRV
jgi:hypothetical protein